MTCAVANNPLVNIQGGRDYRIAKVSPTGRRHTARLCSMSMFEVRILAFLE